MTRFSGVHTIMPTPFADDGSLDLASLETLTDFLIRLEVDGLVVLGVMGEAPKLSQREQDVKDDAEAERDADMVSVSASLDRVVRSLRGGASRAEVVLMTG